MFANHRQRSMLLNLTLASVVSLPLFALNSDPAGAHDGMTSPAANFHPFQIFAPPAAPEIATDTAALLIRPVADESGAPLDDVCVSLVPAADDASQPSGRHRCVDCCVAAGTDGTYALGNLTAGDYRLAAWSETRAPHVEEIHLEAGGIRGPVRMPLIAADLAALLDDDRDFAGIGVRTRRSGKSLEISEIAARGPADRAGLRVGDVLRSIDAHPAGALNEYEAAALQRGAPGTSVTLDVSRAGQPLSMTVRREWLRIAEWRPATPP